MTPVDTKPHLAETTYTGNVAGEDATHRQAGKAFDRLFRSPLRQHPPAWRLTTPFERNSLDAAFTALLTEAPEPAAMRDADKAATGRARKRTRSIAAAAGTLSDRL